MTWFRAFYNVESEHSSPRDSDMKGFPKETTLVRPLVSAAGDRGDHQYQPMPGISLLPGERDLTLDDITDQHDRVIVDTAADRDRSTISARARR